MGGGGGGGGEGGFLSSCVIVLTAYNSFTCKPLGCCHRRSYVESTCNPSRITDRWSGSPVQISRRPKIALYDKMDNLIGYFSAQLLLLLHDDGRLTNFPVTSQFDGWVGE